MTTFKKFNNYILILIGIMMISLFIWFRFIRERLPKEIPFELTGFRFISLLSLCLGLIFMVYLKFRKISKVQSEITISSLLYKPLEELDNYIKNSKSVKKSYYNFFEKYLETLEYYVEEEQIYQFTYLFPKIILTIVLMIDVYFFHYLNYVYKIVFFTIIIMCSKYFIYSIKTLKDSLICEIKPFIKYIGLEYDDFLLRHYNHYVLNVDDEDDDERLMYFTLENYIQVQVLIECQKSIGNRGLYFFNIFFTNIEDHNTKITYFSNKLSFIIKLSLIYYIYKSYETHSMNYKNYEYINKLLLINTMLAWLYILVVSVHTVSVKELVLLLWLLCSPFNVIQPFTESFL